MHYIALTGLTPKAKYFYKVKSGAADAELSDEYHFRAPYAGTNGPAGKTRIALYGDMGVYPWNNMENLREDCVDNEIMDLVIHAGDHCYNEGDNDERRADGYMQAFESVIANVPWMPIVGNHEFYSGTKLSRFLDQNWQKWGPLPFNNTRGVAAPAPDPVGNAHMLNEGRTSATTALGAFLSAGNHHAAATSVGSEDTYSESVPSHTSRYFSADFGLVHLVALSLNGYNGVDTCTTECNKAQMEWLEKDLAAVNRTATPWIVAMSHFPFYLQQPAAAAANEEESDTKRKYATVSPAEDDAYSIPMMDQPWLVADECEYEGHARNCTGGKLWNETKKQQQQKENSQKTVGGSEPSVNPLTLGAARDDLEPIFEKYGVDLYWAGHIHFYETFTGPLSKGRVIGNGTHNPKGVIHVCSGNGGPPSPSNCHGAGYCVTPENCLKCIAQPYSYTRLTAHNATDLLWEQVSNEPGSKVIDSWVLHQDNHGQFPPAPTLPPTPAPGPSPAPGANGLVWVPIQHSSSPKDLPASAIVTGKQSTGDTYACLAREAQGGESNLVGSVSFAGGTGHCRVASAGKTYYLSAPYSWSVLTSASSKTPVPKWDLVAKTTKPADLPDAVHVLKVGTNSGGPTYMCRVHSFGGETNIVGSLSYAGGPGHCRVAVSSKEGQSTTEFDVLTWQAATEEGDISLA
jgi:hypothetical protein